MPRLTALIHTHNDALRLGRCLETVYPCDEIVVVDYGSSDETSRVAREYGARIVAGRADLRGRDCVQRGDDWLLCLGANESLTEGLAASLFEWKLVVPEAAAFSISLREETSQGWIEHPAAQLRLVPAGWEAWSENLPIGGSEARVLEGEVLRFTFPWNYE